METVNALKKLDGFRGAKVYFVGGYVRDLIRRKRNDDLDIVVKNISIQHMRKFLNKHGKTKVVNQSFGVPVVLFKAFRCRIGAQITFPRDKGGKFRSSNSLKGDAACRDFTINAMYLPIKSRSRNKIIDYFGGIKDVRRRVIAPVGNPDDRIKESPIRILRALSLASRTKYRIRGDLMSSMKRNVDLIRKVPPELIKNEINDILIHNKPSRYFKMMDKIGILRIIMPELAACVGVKQDKRYHKYDVFKHCLYTCDFIDPDIVLRLSALLHDIGKPITIKEYSDKITFHKHEVAGVRIAKALLQRLRYDKKTIDEVTHLIRLHMYHYVNDLYICPECHWQVLAVQVAEEEVSVCPKCGTEVTFRSGWSNTAVRRFIKRAHITEDDLDDLGNFPLFKLRKAERLGNGYKTIPVTNRQSDFEERIRTVYKESSGFDIKDLDIDGNIIMEMFNLDPSKEVGDILKYLLTKIIENPGLNNRIDLVKLAAEFIYCNNEWEV